MSDAIPDARLVDMVKPDGSVVGLPAYNVEKALARGYRVEGPDERRQRIVKKEFGDRTTEATIAGALRGATFGLSDVLATKLGIVDPTTLSGLEQASPAASLIGEVGGAVIPALLTKKAPTSIVSRLSAAIAPGVTARLGGGLLARGAGLAVAQGVEGAAYGVGSLISDEALGHADVTAENLLSYAGLGAATGAGMGAVFGVGGELAKKAAHGITHATAGSVDRLYQATTGEATGGKLGEMYRSAVKGVAKAHGLVGEGDAAAVEAGLASAKTRAVMQPLSEAEIGGTARDIAGLVDINYRAGEAVMPHALVMKPEAIKGIVTRGNEADVAAASLKMFEDLRATLMVAANQKLASAETRKIVEAGLKYIDEAELVVTGRWSPTPLGKPAKSQFWTGKQEVTKHLHGGPSKGLDNAEAFSVIDQLKRDFGQKEFSQAGVAFPYGKKARGAWQYRNAYESILMPHLENAKLWGEAASKMQTELNDSWVMWYNTRDEFMRKFMSVSIADERAMGRGFAAHVYDADPEKIARELKQVKMGGLRDLDVLEKHVESTKRLADTVGRHYQNLPEDVQRAIADAGVAYPKLAPLVDTVKTRVAGSNALRQMGLGDSVTSTALGYAVAGGPGALTAQMIARPDRIIRTLAALDQMAAKVRGRVTTGVDTFINRGSGVARTAAERLRPAAGVLSGKAGRRDDFEEKALRITNDAADPEGLARRTTAALSSLHQDAPRVTQAMVIKDMQRRAYLFKEMPKATRPPSLFDKPGRRPDVTDFAVDAWLDKFEVAFEPARAIDHLVAGTLTPAHVDALRNTSPETYRSMQSEIMAKVPGSGLPYQDRLRLGMLFGLNLDPTTEPAFVASMKPAPPPKQTHESKGIRKDQQPLEERTASASTALASA